MKQDHTDPYLFHSYQQAYNQVAKAYIITLKQFRFYTNTLFV
jgi:hypothetical protein